MVRALVSLISTKSPNLLNILDDVANVKVILSNINCPSVSMLAKSINDRVHFLPAIANCRKVQPVLRDPEKFSNTS